MDEVRASLMKSHSGIVLSQDTFTIRKVWSMLEGSEKELQPHLWVMPKLEPKREFELLEERMAKVKELMERGDLTGAADVQLKGYGNQKGDKAAAEAIASTPPRKSRYAAEREAEEEEEEEDADELAARLAPSFSSPVKKVSPVKVAITADQAGECPASPDAPSFNMRAMPWGIGASAHAEISMQTLMSPESKVRDGMSTVHYERAMQEALDEADTAEETQ
jgi:hypothetical protein